jgi:hypothetical protein
MPVAIILSSAVLVLVAYALVYRADQSFVNVLTPLYLTFIPGYYVLELIHIYYFGYSASVAAYAYAYSAYAAHFLVFAIAYKFFPEVRLGLPFNVRPRIKWLPYIVLAGSVLVYLPILIEFSDLILSPREIYMKTRSGYGHMYFVSTALTYIAFVLILFKRQSFRGEKLLFFALAAILCLMHGSKGQVVVLLMIAIMYWAVAGDKQISVLRGLTLATAFAVGLGSMFYLFQWRHSDSADGVFMLMSSYADYNRNAMMLIDDPTLEPQYGRLTVEQNVYTRVPRVLYPAKPKDWGTFWLAKKYYPVWFEKETGAPSFGILGVPYADFGSFAILYMMAWSAITGVLLKFFVSRLRTYQSPADFVVVLFLCGVSVIPGGVGYMLPEHLIIAVGLALLLRIRFHLTSRETARVAT